jgi:A/G-specific adenine glycosylase
MVKPSFPTANLLTWFEKRGRRLPWREKRSPYATWISEIMLQQTRVEQAEAYFVRFLQQFPTVKALAAASLTEVLKVWEGLGYYSRARNLKRAAVLLVGLHKGRIPKDYQALIRLPGIGPSTAGAILSLAYNLPYPVLDGNVRRVLIRFFRLEGDPGKGRLTRTLWDLCRSLLPPDRPGPFNEALMELGALLCKPKRTDCLHCPLKEACLGFKGGNPEDLPSRRPVRKIPHYPVTAAVILNRGRILITRRPEKGLLGGLWEFPGGKQEPGESLPECLKREIREELGIEIEVGKAFIKVSHAYSHFRITLHCFFCRKIKGRITPLGVADYRWVTLKELKAYPFPRADQRVIEYLLKNSLPLSIQ